MQDDYSSVHWGVSGHHVPVQSCLTSTEAIFLRTVRDRDLRTATSTITQLLGSESGSAHSVLLYIHSDHEDRQGRGAQDGHLDFHTPPELGGSHSKTWFGLLQGHCCGGFCF